MKRPALTNITNTTSTHSTLPATLRNNTVAALGEFVGTFLFLFFAFAGTQVANTPGAVPEGPGGNGLVPPNIAGLIFISLVFGLSLTANVWAFYRITGGLFNPSVSTYRLPWALTWGEGGGREGRD